MEIQGGNMDVAGGLDGELGRLSGEAEESSTWRQGSQLDR